LLCTNKGGHRFPPHKIQKQKWITSIQRVTYGKAWIPGILP